MKDSIVKSFLYSSAILALFALPLNSQEAPKSGKFATFIKNIAQGVENNDGEAAAKTEAVSATMGAANSGLDKFEDKVLSTSNFTHFELTLGTDTLGLDTGTDTKTEAMLVYRLNETANTFTFNQTSIVNFNDRTTLNTGFGIRQINDDDTVIFGANVFYDYELESKHKRSGAGVELLSSMFEWRANFYNAISGTIKYKTIDETALDGSDMKLTANLPYFYSSNVYYTRGKWKDALTHKVDTKEFGFKAEVSPNLIIGFAALKQDKAKYKNVASLSYSIPLGGVEQPAKVMQDGVWATKLRPIREKLYKPVQRENRIMKKAIKLGVTVSGF
tara:strand:- start:134 stop:1126 length:993 start_codon:yes stop_codon:yes gene_type:complete